MDGGLVRWESLLMPLKGRDEAVCGWDASYLRFTSMMVLSGVLDLFANHGAIGIPRS